MFPCLASSGLDMPLDFSLDFPLDFALDGCDFGIISQIKALNPLIATDSALINPANVGRPIPQRTVRSFNGTTQYATKAVSNYRSVDASGAIEVTFATTKTGTQGFLSSASELNAENYVTFGMREGGKVYIIVNVAGVNTSMRTTNTFADGLTHTAKYISNGTAWSIEVDGVNQALEIFLGSNTGNWFGDVASRDNLNIGVQKRDTLASYFDGTISDVKVYDPSGAVVNQWDIVENGGSVMRDALGVHDLTYINNPVVATDNTVASDPLNERGFSQRMHFDGVNDEVDISPITLAGDFDVSLNLSTDISTSKSFVADHVGAGKTRWFLSTSGNLVFTSSIDSSVAIPHGLAIGIFQDIALRVVRVSGVITAYINGASIGSVASTGTYIISTIGGLRGFGGSVDNFNGIISDVDIDGQYIASGYGVDDWGVGTVQGSPTNAYLVARLDTPAIDVGGNATQWQGSTYPVLPIKRQSNARAFSSAGQHVHTEVLPTASGSIEAYFNPTGFSGTRIIAGSYEIDGVPPESRSYLALEGDKLAGGIGTQFTATIQGTTTLLAGQWYHGKITWDGVTVKLFLDGVEEYSGAQVGSAETGLGAYIGAGNDSGTLDLRFFGALADVRINVNTAFYPLAEGAGTIAYDASSNGNHGTYINNPINTLQDVRHSNLDEGFTLSGGVYIPAINATTDALGNTLTNPAAEGVHNGAETQYDFYNIATGGGTTSAIVASGTTLTDYSFGDSLTNPLFQREVSSVAEDRHTLFSEQLTTEEQESIDKYYE